ncbi:protein transport protein gos1 [Coemansia aciculifera]|uniref:Protein transport protein gos1 n=2 Tax=Coemansia TaxID=4863 RepID=A0A9W8L9K2_9FUNG|nr:protein transport protein gos1 [Coemansia sp. S146]KAJ2750291.1 protein transport protein gos1 [Coemansia pectinata]KAJ2865441.1 protein transport protein gos1 [Coemansia aciculifera]KAJ2875173.1 protein transport protein gos1 [Coemansia aciculifera]
MNSDTVQIELPGAGPRPWDQLLKDVRELEMRFDTRIAEYMRFVQPASPRSAATNSDQGINSSTERQNCVQLESDLSTILGDLEAVIGEMSETVQLQRGSKRVLERHREMYNDYVREFNRYQTNVQAALTRSELLTGSNSGGGAANVADRDRLVQERGRIDQAHTDIDMVLDHAFSVRQDLVEQRSMIGGATSRMVSVTERIPGINLLLGRIRSRKRKEKVVLAIVLSICISILLYVLSG